MKAAAAFSLVSVLGLLGAPARAQQEQRPPAEGLVEDATQAERDATEAAPAPTTEGNIDYDVSYDDTVARSYDDGYDPQAAAQFQDSLAPYGTWIDDDAYGRVWQPSVETVGADFSPYATGGHWALTEYGWTWISAWDWGWAPFHYGRWLAVSGRGWCWIPGTLWGPAWVTWRAGGGYVGWAPLPPRHMRIGSPLGPRSAWRFTTASDLWRGQPTTLPAQMAPRIFGRMTVVSNPRALPIPGAQVRVNAGPSLTGAPVDAASRGVARLATIAPGTLPRRAIEAHAGAPIAQRPWMRAGGVAAVVSGDRGIASRDRAIFSADRSYIQRAAGPAPRGGPMRMPPAGAVPRAQGQARTISPAAMPGRRAAPGFHAPAMTGTIPFRASPHAPVFRAPPAAAPRPWGGAAPVRVAPPTYTRPGFDGAPTSGVRPTFGGSRSFGGGASSVGGGRSFNGGGGRSFGGGLGGRRR